MKNKPSPKKATATKKGRTLSLPAEPVPVPEQKPPVIVNVAVGVAEVSAPEPRVVTTLRQSVEVVLKRPKNRPRRAAELQERQRIFQEERGRFADALRPMVEKARQAWAQGNSISLLNVLHWYGPFGLSLLLQERATLDTVESQWLSRLMRINPGPWDAIIQALQKGVPWNDPKLTPAERDAKKKERNQDDRQRRQQAIEEEVQRLQRVGFTGDDLRTQSETGTSVEKAAAKKLLRTLKDVIERK